MLDVEWLRSKKRSCSIYRDLTAIAFKGCTHMSTDAGVREAPHSYHISLNFQEFIDEDLASVVVKWHGRRHVLKINYITPGLFHAAFAVAYLAASTLLLRLHMLPMQLHSNLNIHRCCGDGFSRGRAFHRSERQETTASWRSRRSAGHLYVRVSLRREVLK